MSFLFFLLMFSGFVQANFFDGNTEVHEPQFIHHGYKTTHHLFPYQVRILRKYDENSESTSKCGGSILDDYHVISAAHCFVDYKNSPYLWKKGPYIVIAGASNFIIDDPTTWIKANVQEIHVPKLYIDTLKTQIKFPEGDIAILKLDSSLNLKENFDINSVELPSSNESYADEEANVSGYGVNEFKHELDESGNQITNGYSDGILRFASARVLNNSECQRKWSNKKILESHICAQVKKSNSHGPRGVCFGDSGGPMTVNSNILIGVTNAAPIGCEEKSQPAIYARVSSFLTFIERVRNDIDDLEILSTKPIIKNWENFVFDSVDS